MKLFHVQDHFHGDRYVVCESPQEAMEEWCRDVRREQVNYCRREGESLKKQKKPVWPDHVSLVSDDVCIVV